MTGQQDLVDTHLSGSTTTGSDPVRCAYTVMISESVGGVVTVVVGKRNLSTKRYSFVRMAEKQWPPRQRHALWMLLQKVSWMAETDEELEQL